VEHHGRDSPVHYQARTETLGKLEPRQRAAVLRRYGDRHTLAEVADELGITEAEAGALTRRALRELRAHLIGEPST
jgi:DNA-directed RNA polymerase specialized sigma24 family protein